MWKGKNEHFSKGNHSKDKKDLPKKLPPMSRKDKIALIIAVIEIILPIAIGVMLLFALILFILTKFWLRAY